MAASTRCLSSRSASTRVSPSHVSSAQFASERAVSITSGAGSRDPDASAADHRAAPGQGRPVINESIARLRGFLQATSTGGVRAGFAESTSRKLIMDEIHVNLPIAIAHAGRGDLFHAFDQLSLPGSTGAIMVGRTIDRQCTASASYAPARSSEHDPPVDASGQASKLSADDVLPAWIQSRATKRSTATR